MDCDQNRAYSEREDSVAMAVIESLLNWFDLLLEWVFKTYSSLGSYPDDRKTKRDLQ